MHEYDNAGRLVRSVTSTEPEWDEQERAWALALAAFEDSLCPLCGRPLAICSAPEAEGRVTVPAPTRCHVTTAVELARRPYRDDKKVSQPGALMFTASVG